MTGKSLGKGPAVFVANRLAPFRIVGFRGGGGGEQLEATAPSTAFPAPCATALFLILSPSSAFAHASDRGHVLLLPTGYYLIGGALAVGVSFLALAALPARIGRNRRWALGVVPDWREGTSWLGFAAFAILVAAGLWGSRDPLSNPLPLVVWTLLWVGLTLMQGAVGDLWAWINPWYGPFRAAERLKCRLRGNGPRTSASEFGGREDGPGLVHLPESVGYWPAVASLFAFVWFELIDPAPDDPARLAIVAAAYWTVSLVFMVLFGFEPWARRGEFLSVFFRAISRFGILGARLGGHGRLVSLGWPGAKLDGIDPLPINGVLLLLLALAAVSFDGLSKTFFWLGLNDINPLEFPGRSAVMAVNTVGLMLAFAVLSGAFFLCVWLGERLVGGSSCWSAAGLLVWSIVPIALAYHFSHYLVALIVNGQYAIVALSDPFERGWNLFGTADMAVEAALASGHGATWTLWNAQALAIVGGHALAVLVAHRLATRLHPEPHRATLSQLPLTVLMIGYTLCGLWLLSTPTAG